VVNILFEATSTCPKIMSHCLPHNYNPIISTAVVTYSRDQHKGAKWPLQPSAEEWY